MQTQVIPMKDLAELITLQLEKGGRAKLTVTGFSMRPMLHERRDSVVLIPVRQRQSAGDVILYLRENGQYVLHRIIAQSAVGCDGILHPEGKGVHGPQFWIPNLYRRLRPPILFAQMLSGGPQTVGKAVRPMEKVIFYHIGVCFYE